MRKITRDVCNAFINGNGRSVNNTSTDGDVLLLHGNRIAWRDGDRIVATLAGWPTVTTRERLNGLCQLLDLGRPFHQSRRQQFFGTQQIGSMDQIVLNADRDENGTTARVLTNEGVHVADVRF